MLQRNDVVIKGGNAGMRVAIGQFGGPTTVLNASLFGALRALCASGASAFGVVGGGAGLANGRFVPLPGKIDDFAWLKDTPGAALRSGRQAAFANHVDVAVKNLRDSRMDGLLLVGGNGTMELADSLQREAQAQGYPLRVMGIPKTIDNDVVGIDHTPGYPSAARFVLQALRDLAQDLDAMTGFEQVRVVEVMGRNTGWLAAVASLLPTLSQKEGDRTPRVPAPVICLPEQAFVRESFLEAVEHRLDVAGQAMVVVSEGLKDETGRRMTQMGGRVGADEKAILGGVGAHVARLIQTELGGNVRYENLGALQRCFADTTLPQDREEAMRLGEEGARALLAEDFGKMVGVVRASPNGADEDSTGFSSLFRLTRIPLSEVAGRERLMTQEEQRLDEDFGRWLKPLVAPDTLQTYRKFPSEYFGQDDDFVDLKYREVK